MVVGDNKRTSNIMDGIENTGDVRLHDHRLRLKQRFDIVRKLGQGTYGKVQLGINKKTGQEVAIKTIKKCKIESEADLIRIRREVQIMSSVRHPNIVHIYEVFENSEKMILVMEYCSGGELYDYLSQKKVLQEDEARRLFRQIATAVYYCHIHKICHRDLKLENVLLDDTGSAKIADFGLSNVFKETSLLSTFCGSPLYASPEIVKGTPYIGPEVDCWSLGVLLYTLVYGAMPFDGSNFKRLVRQISNGDYYEPKNPSSASPLIRDMLTVDPLKRADIAYICDNPWVNMGCETSCLEMAEMLAAETPVRLDLLLSLAPAAPSHCNSVVVPPEAELGPEESCTDLTSSTSMAVEPSNSAEKRILELVAEGGEDAIKPSPTRTLVSAGENKRKLDAALSASGLHRKKERVASCASIAAHSPVLPEEGPPESPDAEPSEPEPVQPTLQSSATMTIAPAPIELAKDATVEIVKPAPKEEEPKDKTKPRVPSQKKIKPSPSKFEEKLSPEKQEEPKTEEPKPGPVSAAAEQLTALSLAPAATPAPAAPHKPKKLSIPGGNVGSFKEQFERRASLTTPEVKRNVSKPVVSKIAKPKAQSEDRELSAKTPENNGTVTLQQIGIEPSPTPAEEVNRIGVKKTESEPSHSSNSVDPSVLLQDARRSLQNSMAKLVEEKQSEESRRRAARDIISSAIRTGKPPVPYGRSSSAGVASLASPPGTPPAAPRVFRTEAQHRVEDHRNSGQRGVSVERIIPIHMSEGVPADVPKPVQAPPPAVTPLRTPLRRLASTESGPPSASSEACSSPGEPIKKSAREFIIPIAVEGKGYVTPRQRSAEPEPLAAPAARLARTAKPRRISLVSGGESEEEDDTHMHRLRSTRAARAESVSSGEEDEEDEGFHLLTAENLFSTLLHRVRALTQRLNGEEGPGFPQSSHSLFNNLQSPFFNSPHLPRRNLFTHRYVESKRSISETREGWGSRDMGAPFDAVFGKRAHTPRGNTKKSGKQQAKSEPNAEQANAPSGLDLSDLDLSAIQFSDAEMRALSGLTPALSRRLQQQLLAHLPPAAARSLRRTLSLQPAPRAAPPPRSRSLGKPRTPADTAAATPGDTAAGTTPAEVSKGNEKAVDEAETPEKEPTIVPNAKPDEAEGDDAVDLSVPQYCTLPRIRRRSSDTKESISPPSVASEVGLDRVSKLGTLPKELGTSRGSSLRSTPDRPLLSKYLTPERTLSLDESYSSDSGSILSEPSYIAAYGSPAGNLSGLGFRRHSMRLAGDHPRRRVSRFLRSDFFDTPPDESVYAKHKKEKELETQKILKEIREKKNKSLESSGVKSPVDAKDIQPLFKDDSSCLRKCLSPVSNLIGKERSRSNTPFFPILDNIKETNLDCPVTLSDPKLDSKLYGKLNDTKQKSQWDENSLNKESKMVRPKSYPVKNHEPFEENSQSTLSGKILNKDTEADERKLPRESKLIRPKSYPTSSPSPEKMYVNRSVKKESKTPSTKEESNSPETKTDIEVSFSITLPRKNKSLVSESDSNKKLELAEQKEFSKNEFNKKVTDNSSNLTLKKYQILNPGDNDGINMKDQKNNSETAVGNGVIRENLMKIGDEDNKTKIIKSNGIKSEDVLKSADSDTNEKKGAVKKKIIKKVTSKSKIDSGGVQEVNEPKKSVEKKKVTKKVKDKTADESTKTTVTKKKSVLQSIGHKLEKLASSKSNSPEKSCHNNAANNECKKDTTKMTRAQREQSVPVNKDPPTESNLIKRAVTITDVAALENQNTSSNKTTVSKVLGLFKKFDSKDKVLKSSLEKSLSVDVNEESNKRKDSLQESLTDNDKEKPRRPTSLLLNGLSRKNKYGKSASDNSSANSLDNDDQLILFKKDNETKNIRNSLKLDFSRLPRVKKIVPTNPVIEPQIMNISAVDKETDNKHIPEKNDTVIDDNVKVDIVDTHSRSRSRSRSTYSNSDIRSENSAEIKYLDKNPFTSTENSVHSHLRNHESTTPEKEDIVDRIRRKSFYSRFNEKKQRRKSSLVGPGATEYDPVARIHSQPTETKFDVSPTSPGIYDISPGYSIASDLSPSTDRYRNLLTDLPISTRNNLRYDSLNDKVDTYRSLDRNDFRKYPGSRSYLDYDQPLSYGSSRYSRTKSLLDSADGTDDQSLTHREPHKYNRTNSLYTPGSYATYRPKRTLNTAILLKGEKEPSPENILDKIRQRKISISVTRKPDSEKDPLPRSTVSPKGEGDGAERSEKAN
ncbi:uncharacterized protein Nuak isoform X2 [Epargyreus clarus]|uniref:uncharacterized protein Nuak isoform X2 n=1 Tax=Epargyreus clarus TaxID=520877 RepID=UPI003C30AD66